VPAKVDIGTLLTKHLGKEVAAAMVAKIDKMITEKKSAPEIEKVIQADLAAHVEKEVTAALISKIGPIIPIKVSPIQTDVKSKVGVIGVSAKVGPPIQVKVGPQIKVAMGPSMSVEVAPGPFRKGSK